MEKVFKRDIQALDAIFDFLEERISNNNLNESLAFTLKFAVEEVFTNMVKYNPLGPDQISISLVVKGENAIVELVDFEDVPFDITKTEPVNFDLPMEEKNPGGLGIHLVKTMVDKVDYQHINNRSKVTLTIKLGR